MISSGGDVLEVSEFIHSSGCCCGKVKGATTVGGKKASGATRYVEVAGNVDNEIHRDSEICNVRPALYRSRSAPHSLVPVSSLGRCIHCENQQIIPRTIVCRGVL